MPSLLIAALATLMMLTGATIGIVLNRRLPDHHLSDATKDIVKLSTGIIATIAGLVLSLLIATAKSSYDAVDTDVKSTAADFIMLDRVLAQMGPDAASARGLVRQTLENVVKTDLNAAAMAIDEQDPLGRVARLHEETERQIRTLALKSPADEWLRQRALSLASDMSKARWMLQEEVGDTLPGAFLWIVMLWLAIIFAGFGLFTPANPTAVGALVIGAVSISAALLLINELNTPFSGLVQISSAPLAHALKIIGPVP